MAPASESMLEEARALAEDGRERQPVQVSFGSQQRKGARAGLALVACGLLAALLMALAASRIEGGRAPARAAGGSSVFEVAEEVKKDTPAAKKEGKDKHAAKKDEDKPAAKKHGKDKAVAKKDDEAPEPDQGMGFPTNTFWPTLFCFSVMNKDNYQEVQLIKGQLEHRIGIFACDNVAVLSAAKVYLGKGHKFKNGSSVPVYSWVNPVPAAPMGNIQGGDNTNSFKNTGIFVKAWNILVQSGAVFGHNWTVKVDPDAVLFPERLRWHLKKHTYGNQKFYMKNCNYKGQAALYGSLEVFNEAAMHAYKQMGSQCLALPWGGWGEDQYIDTCMWQKLGAIPQNDYQLVGDHRCMDASCSDTWRASFHDYKTWDAWYACHQTSANAQKLKEEGAYCCMTSPLDDPCNKCPWGQRRKPGDGQFCGDGRWNCHKCGAGAHWCKKNGTHGYMIG